MNKEKLITAIIEKAKDGGYGIYCPEIQGVALYGYGLTEEEAKENLCENLESILDYYRDENEPVPNILNNGKIHFEYKYDFSGFFKACPFFNVSELANEIGINPSLMRKYKNGLVYASKEQRQKIESGIYTISKKLSTVHF